MVFMPKKVGFFHFGSDERTMPDRLLERAMEEAGGTPCLRQSIIVLPEAFNIGVKYAREVLDELVDSPSPFDQATVSALIRMDGDVWGGGKQKRSEALQEKVEKLGGSCRIICVPANTRQYQTTGIAEKWADAGCHVVVANGCCLPEAGRLQAGYFPSVIGVMGKAQVAFQESRNVVMVEPLGA
jgi:hypothetical protein